jgi:hypothetical protein
LYFVQGYAAMKFIQLENHYLNLDAIGYVDFLDSGRAMVFVPGLHVEKQNLSIDKAAAARLKAHLDSLSAPAAAAAASPHHLR